MDIDRLPGRTTTRPPSTGVRWLDIAMATVAVTVSACSMLISYWHVRQTVRQNAALVEANSELVRQNQHLVEASTLPILSIEANNFDEPTGRSLFRLRLRNAGSGPAFIDWFIVQYKGRNYAGGKQFLADCCGPDKLHQGAAAGVLFSNASGTILPARDNISLLATTGSTPDDEISALKQASQFLDVSACFCSVLDECWMTNFATARPRQVSRCQLPAGIVQW